MNQEVGCSQYVKNLTDLLMNVTLFCKTPHNYKSSTLGKMM